MKIFLLILVSIVGPLSSTQPTAEKAPRPESSIIKSDPKKSTKATEKTAAKEPNATKGAPADALKNPNPAAPVVRRPRQPAYLFM